VCAVHVLEKISGMVLPAKSNCLKELGKVHVKALSAWNIDLGMFQLAYYISTLQQWSQHYEKEYK